ncbi:MAG TPA: ABC transporter permease [Acidobacteriota bacterium]|nr:ABC transporter permease [Acidobacteriota bacterium]
MSTDTANALRSRGRRLLRDYGMLIVLLLLCVFFSIVTISEQQPVGEDAARALMGRLDDIGHPCTGVVMVGRATAEDSLFLSSLRELLTARDGTVVGAIRGNPATIREYLTRLSDSGTTINVIAAPRALLPVLDAVRAESARCASAVLVTPPSERWPTFLLADNLRNVANQISVIAIIAIGMTMVIISGGIDLSVGSLIALSAVVAAWLIASLGGAVASVGTMWAACAGAIVLCGVTGAFSGWMITSFRIPPFIATLAMMQVAAGLAYIISQGKPIYQIPDSFVWLGRGAEPLMRIPHAVILMALLYLAAHLVMARTTLGRYIYAVGGNSEAARLAGIRVRLVQFVVYTVCGTLAGLGGVVMASQLKSGAPTYGLAYELHVIAAVVVGGTSLSGGEGRIFGTLIGALVIGVIQNGMNLTNVESYTQKVILGLVILAAVLLDQLKHRGRGMHRWFSTGKSAARKS